MALVARFGDAAGEAHASFWMALAMPFVWVLSMQVARAYEQRFLWAGPEEFRPAAS